MVRRLSAEERALWRKVIETVQPFDGRVLPARDDGIIAPVVAKPVGATPTAPATSGKSRPEPGTTLDGTWDRRLSRGLVAPELVVDLHGHNLASAHDWLDRQLETAIQHGMRLLLLITGKSPAPERRPTGRGAIRASVGDWLAVSRHAGDIAAVRNAHPRHGGAGALYIVLRRRRTG